MGQAGQPEVVFSELVDNHPERLSQRAVNLRTVIYRELSEKDILKDEGLEFTTQLNPDLAGLNIAVSREDDYIIVRCSGISKGILDIIDKDNNDILSSVEIVMKPDGTIVYEAYWLEGENPGILELSQVVNPNYKVDDMLSLQLEMDCKRVPFAVISGTNFKIPIFKNTRNRVVQKYIC